jgi:hypothetical protein
MAEQGLVKRETFTEIERSAKLFADSGYFPDAKSAAQAYVKIQTGREMGIPMMAAMTGIAIIQGKPVVGANIIASKVKSSGYDYRVRYLENDGCKIEFFKGDESLGISTFMEDDAKAAGLTGKDNWKKYARNMYFARAISNGQRWYCPDATSGTTVYTPDELGGKVDEEGNPVVDKQGNAVIDAEYTELPKREEPPPEGEEEKFDREGALKDTESWLLEMAGNDEERFHAILRQVSEYTPKNGGASKWVMNREHLQRVSDKWLNIIVHHAEERYNEFKAIQE